MKSKLVVGIDLTSPKGRGRRVAPGEGLRSNDRPYPLTPTLSRSKSDISDFDNVRCPTRVNPSWVEREHTVVVVTAVEQVSGGGEVR
jgi:hypothetical protein